MDNKEEKSETTSQLPIEGAEATKSKEIAEEEILDAPKIVTFKSDVIDRGAEQVTEEENNTIIAGEGNKSEKEEKDRIESSEKELKCRPIAFLLGLPFALISLVIAFIGVIIWIIGLMLTCICPCCFCVTVLVEMALGLLNAPFQLFHYITDKIPF
ncbi:uncharacterized protein LOC107861194 [Capsicum annuum]|uniref:uncharacterized protein LOC107861194 n=1 Tax=Capsicum annuum TaxID=4072 RepID=UPI001FB11FF4|nr:uncharacterized protein LOC107861194 [Capsicum annuum]